MPDRNLGDQERRHWRRTFTAHPDMYGTQPSEPAQHAIDQFTWKHCHATLELAAGQGRDTLAFLAAGFDVTALDYEADALRLLEDTAGRLGVTDRLVVVATTFAIHFPGRTPPSMPSTRTCCSTWR